MNGENTRINHGIRQMNKSINTSHRFYLSVFMFIHSSVPAPSNSAFFDYLPRTRLFSFPGTKADKAFSALVPTHLPFQEAYFPKLCMRTCCFSWFINWNVKLSTQIPFYPISGNYPQRWGSSH